MSCPGNRWSIVARATEGRSRRDDESIAALIRPAIFLLATTLAFSSGAAWPFDFKGPYGGDVRSLAISFHSPNVVLVGTTDGQIFRSENSGGYWERTMGLGRGAVVDNLVFDPGVSGRVYAAAWELNNSGGGLYRSDDSGGTWTPIAVSGGSVSIRALAVAAHDSDTLLVGALDGVYLSRDEGKSWELISAGERELINIESVAIDPKSAGTFYAGTWHLGAKTIDGGKTWTWVKRGMSDDSDLFSIAVHPETPEVVYASTCSGVYKSTNGGNLWAKLSRGLPAEARRTRAVYVDPVNHDRVFAGTTQGLFLSDNAGISWRRISSPDLTINSVAVNQRNGQEIYLATDDAGILKSEDGGGTFRPANTGFSHRQVAQLVSDPRDRQRLYASVLFDRSYGGLFISDDGGANWRQSNRGIPVSDTNIYSILPSAGSDNIFLGTSNGIYVSKNRGGNWTKLGAPQPNRSGSKVFQARLQQLEFLSWNEQKLAAAATDGLYLGDLKTGKWIRVSLPAYNGGISSVLVDRENNTLFAGAGTGLFVSRDGGKVWEFRGDGLPIVAVRALERVPAGGILIAGTSYGLYRSADDGRTWTRITSGIPPIDISVLRKTGGGRSVFAGDFLQGNIYVSTTLGATWRPLTEGMNSGLSSLLVDPSDDSTLFLGSRTDGIYALRLSPPAAATAGVVPSR